MRRRRELGSVERGGHRRDADAEADDQPADHQQEDIGREGLQQGACHEQQAGDQHGLLASIMVGEVAAEQRTAQRAERHPARHHLDQDRAQAEMPLYAAERAGNDALVVAEQQARHDDDAKHHQQRCSQRLASRLGQIDRRLRYRHRSSSHPHARHD
jgi:hypothetical protein